MYKIYRHFTFWKCYKEILAHFTNELSFPYEYFLLSINLMIHPSLINIKPIMLLLKCLLIFYLHDS